jgi:adiponectin receptor
MHHDNPYLIKGYRPMPTNSYLTCFKSAFTIHNETLNIYTHLFGAFYFLYVMLFLSPNLIKTNSNFELFSVAYCFPLGCFIVLMGSAVYHTFKCNSIYDYLLFLRIDFTGKFTLI